MKKVRFIQIPGKNFKEDIHNYFESDLKRFIPHHINHHMKNIGLMVNQFFNLSPRGVQQQLLQKQQDQLFVLHCKFTPSAVH